MRSQGRELPYLETLTCPSNVHTSTCVTYLDFIQLPLSGLRVSNSPSDHARIGLQLCEDWWQQWILYLLIVWAEITSGACIDMLLKLLVISYLQIILLGHWSKICYTLRAKDSLEAHVTNTCRMSSYVDAFVTLLMVLFIWYVTSVDLTSFGNVTHFGVLIENPGEVDGPRFELLGQTECNYSVGPIHRH